MYSLDPLGRLERIVIVSFDLTLRVATPPINDEPKHPATLLLAGMSAVPRLPLL